MNFLQQRSRHMTRMLRNVPGFRAWIRLINKRNIPHMERELFGLVFPHPVGLAPVLDGQEDLLDGCNALGFSFSGISLGNKSVQGVIDGLTGRKSPVLASVELSAEGALEESAKDSLIRNYALLYDFTDFFIVDINRLSGQTSFDDISDWTEILDELLTLRLCYDRYTPILLRLPPAYSDQQTERVLDYCLLSGIDGVVASGPVKVRQAVDYTKGRIPVVGSGAVTTTAEAVDLIQAGASLLELAQGIPGHTRTTVHRILRALENENLSQ